MMTFDDLEFIPNSMCRMGPKAGMEFDNGYGIMVVTIPEKIDGQTYYTGIVILDGDVAKPTEASEASIECPLTADQVTCLMAKVALLSPPVQALKN